MYLLGALALLQALEAADEGEGPGQGMPRTRTLRYG